MSPSQPAGRPIGKGRVAPVGALLVAVLAAAVGAGGASAAEPVLPVVGAELPRGTLTVRDTGADPEAAARRRVVDGDPSDWAGERTGFAGAVTYSRGELVHEDHLWDASGAAAGDVAGRTALLDALAQSDPALYRAEAVTLYLPSGTHYGAGPVDLVADLTEVRVALAPEGGLTLLARTTEMTAERQPAVLVLLDTRTGTRRHAVPFGSGLTTEAADVAVLLSGRAGVAVDLETGARTAVPAAARPDGYDNAVEGAVPRALLGDGAPRIAVAAGRLDPAGGELAPRGAGPAIANVAFRAEPARPSFEKRQALALHGGSIDAFFTGVDVDRLRAGTTQETVPGPGYHDRIFRSDPAMSREQGRDGVLQHYGAYVPKGLPAGTPRPSSLFLHGSGNDAHDLPLILPGLTRALGDELGAVVVAPKGRTAFSLWEGAGLADVLEATHDATRAFGLDRARTRVAGYSMGGLGAFLLSALMPDRFAASYSIAGPVGGDVRSPGVGLLDLPDVRRLFRNLRSVPTLLSGGGIDNNVPLTNGLAAAATLSDLGYRHRLQAFPADHHFSPGAIDRWADAVAYLRPFDRVDPNPPRVSFVRDMAIEHEVRTAALSDQELRPAGGHRHEFGGAFWLDELTPADPEAGVAIAEARSLAIPERPVRTVAESGVGATPDPYLWRGLAWRPDRAPTTRSDAGNGFDLHLSGAAAVRLDARRMRLDPGREIRARVATDRDVELRLSGRWGTVAPTVARGDGTRLDATATRRGLVLRLPAGEHELRLEPAVRCLARRLAVRPEGLGELRLGRTAAALARRAGTLRAQSATSVRLCVTGGGRAAASLRRGRAELALTTAVGHRVRSVGRGATVRHLRTRLPGLRSVGGGVEADRRTRAVVVVRDGRVRAVGTASPALLDDPGRLAARTRALLR